MQKALETSSQLGTEHEFSINDKNFQPLPISDRIIQRLNGSLKHEVAFGGIKVSKELQSMCLS